MTDRAKILTSQIGGIFPPTKENEEDDDLEKEKKEERDRQ